MVSAGQVAAFGVAAFILIVIPGPSLLFVVGRALAHGRLELIGGAGGLAMIGLGLPVAVTGRKN